MLIGHGGVAAVSLYHGWYLVPVLLSLGPFYNGWLFFLCNATQHVGLQPHQPDFRRNSRTFYLHPLLRFCYWNMNYHIEHHMYAAVPFYNLPALHEAIKHDLPPTPDGIAQTWRVIADAVRKQDADPTWAQPVQLPGGAGDARGTAAAAATGKGKKGR
jgi:fatty acid desaturase